MARKPHTFTLMGKGKHPFHLKTPPPLALRPVTIGRFRRVRVIPCRTSSPPAPATSTAVSFFANVEQVPGDPILGLTEAYNADSRTTKVNLGVGIYYDENGRIPLLRCVYEIEQKLALEPQFTGDAYAAQSARQIPKTLGAAAQALDGSAMLRAALGDQVIDHYLRAAEWELEEHDRVVTDWELAHGFERA